MRPAAVSSSRDVPHAVAAALALLLRRERLARADLVEDVARQLGDAAGELAAFIAEEAAVIGIRRVLGHARELERLGVVPARMPAAVADRRSDVPSTLRRDAARVSGTSSLVSSNITALTHWPGGVLSAFCLEVGQQLAHAPHVGVDAVELVDAADVAVRVDEAGRHGHACCASMTCVRGVARLRTSAVDPTATKRPFLTANASARGSARIDGVDARVDDDQVGFDAGPCPRRRRGLLRVGRQRREAACRECTGTGECRPKAKKLPAGDFRHGRILRLGTRDALVSSMAGRWHNCRAGHPGWRRGTSVQMTANILTRRALPAGRRARHLRHELRGRDTSGSVNDAHVNRDVCYTSDR